MYYCFFKDDIQSHTGNIFSIQYEYAKRIDKHRVILLSNTHGSDNYYEAERTKDEPVLLRCSYDLLLQGFTILGSTGANLLEDKGNFDTIESWYRYGLAKRQIIELTMNDLLSDRAAQNMASLLHGMSKIFIKSKKKGFSAIINANRIMSPDYELKTFLEEQCDKYGHELLLSQYYPLRLDSLGTRETRHIIIDNKVLNSSRCVHSIQHSVPKSHKEEAGKIAREIRALANFPRSYVLDVGEFINAGGQPVLDIVEINPLSCSICYINNSVFQTPTPEIDCIYQRTHMGFEFCYDALIHPDNYSQSRVSNKSYSYFSNEHYKLM